MQASDFTEPEITDSKIAYISYKGGAVRPWQVCCRHSDEIHAALDEGGERRKAVKGLGIISCGCFEESFAKAFKYVQWWYSF